MKELTYRKLMGQLRKLEITEGVEQYSFENLSKNLIPTYELDEKMLYYVTSLYVQIWEDREQSPGGIL